MIGVIIAGHGNFATGVESAIKMIAGACDNLISVDFEVSMNENDLRQKIDQAINELNKNEHIIVFCDILGGSPFKISVEQSNSQSIVVYGSNVSFILEVVIERNNIECFDDWFKTKMANARKYIGVYEYKEVDLNQDEDGI